MRLFVGLPLAPDAANDLADRARVWEGRPGLRPVRRENWHLTLRFLGETPADRTEALGGLVAAWAKGKGPLTFIDRGWGCFGSYRAPRVVVRHLEALPAVRRSVESLLKTLDASGFAGDGKEWKPHVTLAYGKGEDPGDWPVEPPGGRPPVLFRRVVVYQSTLGPGGSEYQELTAVDLTGPGASPSSSAP